MRSGSSLVVIVLLALAVGLSACGRKGALERPTTATTGASGEASAGPGDPPRRPFILDGLVR